MKQSTTWLIFGLLSLVLVLIILGLHLVLRPVEVARATQSGDVVREAENLDPLAPILIQETRDADVVTDILLYADDYAFLGILVPEYRGMRKYWVLFDPQRSPLRILPLLSGEDSYLFKAYNGLPNARVTGLSFTELDGISGATIDKSLLTSSIQEAAEWLVGFVAGVSE